jgi:hemoglobin
MTEPTASAIPTLYTWAGGTPIIEHLTQVFYSYVQQDALLQPIFAQMSPDHPQHVAVWLGEIFGGPRRYSEQFGGHQHMVSKHLGRHLTEEQRSRWMQLLLKAADDVGLPTDPEFRSAFVAYIEWGTRMAVLFSKPGVGLPPSSPMPYWGWGERPPYVEPTES